MSIAATLSRLIHVHVHASGDPRYYSVILGGFERDRGTSARGHASLNETQTMGK